MVRHSPFLIWDLSKVVIVVHYRVPPGDRMAGLEGQLV